VRAVVAVCRAGVPEVTRVADEVVAALVIGKEPQIDGRIGADVLALHVLERRTGHHAGVDGVWTHIAVPAALRRDGSALDVRWDRGLLSRTGL
jgi:hypothetical protein